MSMIIVNAMTIVSNGYNDCNINANTNDYVDSVICEVISSSASITGRRCCTDDSICDACNGHCGCLGDVYINRQKISDILKNK